MRPALFLDRDGTIVEDRGYMHDPALVEFLPGAPEVLNENAQKGWALFVVSNQSGVGRGLITRGQVSEVNAELKRQLDGDYIQAFYHSYATPDDPYATDRKPSPELLLQAAQAHDLDLAASFFIGDRLSDIECGINAGCRTVLLTHEKSSRKDSVDPEDAVAREKAHYITSSLKDAAKWIIEVSSNIPWPKTHELE